MAGLHPGGPQRGAGTNTGEGQHGAVWFLGVNQTVTWIEDGVGVGAADWTITMPAGKFVFFPVWSTEADVASGNGTTYAELAASNDLWVAHVTELAATVDGRPLHHLFAYRAGSSLLELQWAVGNLWQRDPGEPTDAVSDGFWIMLTPLCTGHQ